MRKFVRIISIVLLLLITQQLLAQEKTVTGTVFGEDNNPLSGVSVTNTKTKKSTITNEAGSFSIQGASGQFLTFSYIGFTPQTATVTFSGNITINLKKSLGNQLEEVVVTAMDIKRKPRELGYSVQTVSGAEIKESQRENFVNSLQGRVAGLTITPTNGQAGASSQIVLRGFNSLSLSNSPLFVVDGIILDNSTVNETSNGGSGVGLASDRPNRNNDYTNRMADINPNDIESVTVLKGPEATALYGSQASSGAIIITTKKASAGGKLTIGYDNSFRVTNVNRTADVNNDFGPGSNGTSNASNVFSATSGSYFGARYYESTPRYDNIKNFFRTGFA
ncbi:MAG TPA: TonB-dependent receptor plug domain-containing protein, partial [Segetibacter sp.]